MLGPEAGVGVIVSTDYIEITEAEALARPLADAWQNPSIPEQQLALTDGELQRWRRGEDIAPFKAFVKALLLLPRSAQSLLEIGCGVGHYAEVIPTGDFHYTGVDYSEEFIRVAKARRPWWKFEVMDALALEYDDIEFDVAISSCCILHIVDWRKALAEACRVSRRYVILHRTPVSDEPTRYFLKKAYGVECVEIHFNRAEVIGAMRAKDFEFKSEIFVTEGQSTLVFERAIFHQPV